MFLNRIAASAGDDRSVYGNFYFEPLGNRTSSGMRVTPAAALGLPIVWACINVLAKSFAVMPFSLYRPKESGRGRAAIRDHWLFRLISKSPNRFQSPYEWRLMLMGHLALRGNAFCQISADSSGGIVELLPLHPDRMQVEMLQNGSYRYLYTDQYGKQIVFMRTEIWHLRGMSNDGILGLSPIDMARESVGEGLAMQSYSSRFFANDARPGGWIEYDGRFSDKGARQTFKESWQENYGGKNLRKVAVLEKGMKYHELTLNNSDAQFVEGRRDKVSEIARVFGVPPHKVGDLSKATFSNIEQQSIEFWTDTMLPWAELWESSIESFILGPEVDLEPEFDMRRMMRGDGAARGTRINQLVMSGVMTPNEGREEESMDPLPGLDQTWRPLNMAPVDEDGDTPAAEMLELPGAQDDPKPTTAPSPTGSRMAALLKDNANRMARRIAKGDPPRVEVLAAALAMSRDDVALLLAQVGDMGASEEQLSADLFEAAMRYQQ